jgi:hypothetical protein
MLDFLLTLGLGVFIGLGLAVMFPDIAVVPAGMLRRAWAAIQNWRKPK